MNGTAEFVDTHTIMVDGQEIKADHIVISTGSSAFVPNMNGLEEIDY